MAKEKDKKDPPLVSLTQEEREEVWDDIFVKEECIILEFDNDLNVGKIKSIADGQVYAIDGRELLRTKIELRLGDKVLFAPVEDSEGNDYARVIRIMELNT
jgi:hypothetical protein